MAKKTKPVVIYLWRTNQDQPWRYAIDDVGVGPVLTPDVRYTRKSDAKRGAIRKVLKLGIHIVKGWHRSIEFIYSKPKRK